MEKRDKVHNDLLKLFIVGNYMEDHPFTLLTAAAYEDAVKKATELYRNDISFHTKVNSIVNQVCKIVFDVYER